MAEDDETSDLLLTLALKDISHTILHAKTGTEAVEKVLNDNEIDLVMMDINMPEMDGYDVTRQIRQSGINVIIIAQTAIGLAGDNEKAIEAGCTDFFSKPIDQILIKSLIEKHTQFRIKKSFN